MTQNVEPRVRRRPPGPPGIHGMRNLVRFARDQLEVLVMSDAVFLARYLADYRFVLQKIGSDKALVHLEPDFWGYAQQVNADPHAIPAAVATANPADCAAQENSIAGLGRCMIAMARKYAPHARVGLHASGWATSVDVMANADPTLDVASEAAKVAQFLVAAGRTTATSSRRT